MLIPDPSIARCALVLTEEARREVEKRILRGEVWYLARDRVLGQLVPIWLMEYGEECSDIAVRAVHAIRPTEFLSTAGKRQDRANWRKYWAERNKCLGRNQWPNRLFTAALGWPLY
jgi:hypothetical protein